MVGLRARDVVARLDQTRRFVSPNMSVLLPSFVGAACSKKPLRKHANAITEPIRASPRECRGPRARLTSLAGPDATARPPREAGVAGRAWSADQARGRSASRCGLAMARARREQASSRQPPVPAFRPGTSKRSSDTVSLRIPHRLRPYDPRDSEVEGRDEPGRATSSPERRTSSGQPPGARRPRASARGSGSWPSRRWRCHLPR